jgi:cephalosporin hydroxylase
MAYPDNPPFWTAVRGFFDFEDVYRMLVERAKDGDTIVEVGVFLGRSALFLGDAIRTSGKRVTLLAVDVWCAQYDFGNGDVIEAPFENFVANVRQAALTKIIVPLRCDSVRAASFVTNDLSAVFIDGDHEYPGCLADIKAWLPKVRNGGTLAGHDYSDSFPGVPKAVGEALGDKVRRMGQCWLHDVP